MFFLLRVAFWVGLVLVLLPRDSTPEAEKAQHIDASSAVSAAGAAVSDMSQFCTRQPAACEAGGAAAIALGHRAQEGARKLYNIITDKRPPDHTSSIDPDGYIGEQTPPEHMLTNDDLAIEWHEPVALP